MARVVFLFNHDSAHHVAHLAKVAAEFAMRDTGVETIVAFSGPFIRSQLEDLISPEARALITWRELTVPGAFRSLAKSLDRLLPASRLLRLLANRGLFEGAAAVVSTERTCLQIKRFLSASGTPRFAKLPHGAGDRSVSYHPDYKRFDMVLVAGQKVVDQLVSHGVDPGRVAIVGYPKFEGVTLEKASDFFGNGRPTFVYNPHFDPHLSSWYDAGPALLRWFANEGVQRFNLIFAPHVMLFRKAVHASPEYRIVRRRPDIPQEARDAPNILIDVDSPRLFDMSYMMGSDAYIGDVSSQVYEFLVRPRPVFFLDRRSRPDPDDTVNHLFWKAGPVARSLDELIALIPRYAEIGEEFRQDQVDLFEYTFSITDRTASQRAADAVERLIGLPDRRPPNP